MPREVRQSGVVVNKASTRFLRCTTSAATMPIIHFSTEFISGLLDSENLTGRIQTGQVWATLPYVEATAKLAFRLCSIPIVWRPTS